MSEEQAGTENAEAATGEKRTICADREKYQKTRTATGKPSLNNGDQVASGLGGLTLEQTEKVAIKILGITQDDIDTKYGHLNEGMQRMTLGNRLRAAVKDEDKNAIFVKMTEKFGAKNDAEREKADLKAAKEKEAAEKAEAKAAKAAKEKAA